MSKTISLDLTFLSITEEAAKHARDFFDLCQEKFERGERKYGYVRGSTAFRAIYEHLLCEVGELIYAVDGENWERSLDSVKEAINSRHKLDRNTASELADVTNLPVLVYICGKTQGTLQNRSDAAPSK